MTVLSRRSALSLLASSLLASCAGWGGKTRPVAALLLPLTGAAAAVGAAMRAAANPSLSADKSPVEIQIFDTAGSPEGAAAATTRAVSSGAQIILGPLFASEVPAVIRAAGSIPVITFSNDSNLVGSGAFVFGLTPSQSVTAIFAFARAQGVRRVTVVALDQAWGRQTIATARLIAPRAGLALQPAIVLNEATDLATLQNRIRQAGAPDAILLADGGARLPQLAQALSGNGIQLLGTSQWSGTDVASIAALQGAWFAAPDSSDLDSSSLGGDLAGNRERLPGLLPTLARDVITVATALAGLGGFSRTSLTREDGFATSLGRVRFAADGSVERDLAILGVSADGVRILSKAAA